MGNEIKFKPATFYLGIVDHLAKAVEGLKPEGTEAERDVGDLNPKRDHGGILDPASHGGVQGETKQAPITPGEGMTGFPSAGGTSGKGKNKDPGPAAVSGPNELTVTPKNHGKATDRPLPATAGIATLTPSACESDSPTSPLRQQSRESEPEDPRPVPTSTHETYDDERR